MRIGTLAHQLGTTPHAIRFYEQRGLLPAPQRTGNGYRQYSEGDAERLRLLIGLRQLDIPCVDDHLLHASLQATAIPTSERSGSRPPRH